MPKGYNSQSEMPEGSVLNGIMYRRIFKEKKHHVQITVGPPGSGKSYQNIRQAELWYKQVLKKPFPIKNICFSTEEVLALLQYYSNNPTACAPGEIIIYEESGTSMGNLDFQTSSSKMFNYVLQSFRSMRLILLNNLPYVAMLNKQTRMLAQFMLESVGIDKAKKVALFKPFYLQTNQRSGEIFYHFPEVVINGYYEPCEVLGYRMPSEEILVEYERKKAQFLRGLISGSLVSMENKDKKRLTPFQCQIYGCWKQGIFGPTEIAKIIGSTQPKVSHNGAYMRAKGYMCEEIQGYMDKPAPAQFNCQDTNKKSVIQPKKEEEEHND